MKLNKKVLLSIPLALSIGFGLNSVFAKSNTEETKKPSKVLSENKNSIQENEILNKDFTLYTNYEGVIKEVMKFSDETVIRVEKENDEIDFSIDKNILILDKKGNISKDLLKVGTKILVYYISNQEAVMIAPPKLKASVIIETDEELDSEAPAIHVDIFSEQNEESKSLISLDKSLIITPSEETVIINKKGEKYEDSLKNKELLVLYKIATLSIPAQTTPNKIIVLDTVDKDKELKEKIELLKNKEELVLIEQSSDKKLKEALTSQKITKIVVNKNTIENVEIKYNKNQIPLLPLRSIVEANGQKVKWDSKDKKIYIDAIISFNLDKDSYVFGRRAPMALGAAPQNFDGINYVPASFFTEFLGLNMNIEKDTIIFTNSSTNIENN